MQAQNSLATQLNAYFDLYNHTDFIVKDPISIPRQFTLKQDIEIAGFIAAILAWGNRTAILNSCNKLMALMDYAPYDFIINHTEQDLKKLDGFVYRTFNTTDLYYFIAFFKHHYHSYDSLENAFIKDMDLDSFNMYDALVSFKNYFFSLEYAPDRTKKHIASPIKNSTCKRINMFMRWMVRKNSAIDFGIWEQIQPKDLIMPIDVHVSRVARKLGLLQREKDDWKAAVELTNNLKEYDAMDPVKYDIALFGAGVNYDL